MAPANDPSVRAPLIEDLLGVEFQLQAVWLFRGRGTAKDPLSQPILTGS
jgi:hypothetical protein